MRSPAASRWLTRTLGVDREQVAACAALQRTSSTSTDFASISELARPTSTSQRASRFIEPAVVRPLGESVEPSGYIPGTRSPVCVSLKERFYV